MVYRDKVPGLPDLYSGEHYHDPLAVTLENVLKHLVGWMTLDELATSMQITTMQAKSHLKTFLLESNFTHKNENGVLLWSSFHLTPSRN